MKLYLKIGLLFFLCMIFIGCFPKMAKTPKIGAEYQLQPETQKHHRRKKPKPPRRLFNERVRKKLVEKGELRPATVNKQAKPISVKKEFAHLKDSSSRNQPMDSLPKRQE